MYGLKECSSCGALYSKSFGCLKGGFVDKFIRDANKTPDSSQQPPHDCLKCENPVDGLYYRQCALLRKKLKEVWFIICDEHEFFQDFLNTFESSNDNTNIVSASQEPFVFNQDPGENSSESPPPIDHHCCYGCGDPLDAWDRVSEIKDAFGNKKYKLEDVQELIRKLFNDVQNIHKELAEYINTPSWNRPAFSNYDDDDGEDYTIVITPEEPDNSLSIRGEHLDTILATESNEVIKSSVENLVPIPSESEDYFSIYNIDYVEASPPDSVLVSLEEVKDDLLREKLLNINLLVAKIKSLNDNPTLDRVLKSPSPFQGYDYTEETSSGSTTTHADYSLPKYDLFLFVIKPDQGELTIPDQGELTIVVIEDNLGEPRVHMPIVLPTHPTLLLDSDFIPSENSLPKSKIFYLDIEEKNSCSTTIHADISFPDLECFYFKIEPDPGELTSIVEYGIRENVLSATNKYTCCYTFRKAYDAARNPRIEEEIKNDQQDDHVKETVNPGNGNMNGNGNPNVNNGCVDVLLCMVNLLITEFYIYI
nr:hypothetical protein [Tanacetum cinerariifolium]